MNKFEKVSYNQYRGDNHDCEKEWEDIILPKRATRKSAAYDFYAPYDIVLNPGETIKIATGIKIYLDEDKCLLCMPRSGLGFKYRLQLDNTIGLIDADYIESYNEGHIFAKITNDTHENKAVAIKKGEAFMQGLIIQYLKTEDDNVTTQRNGGFGSTSK